MHENYPSLTDYTLYEVDDDEFCYYYDGYMTGKIMFNNEWHYYHCYDVLEDYTRLYNVYELTNDLITVLNKEYTWNDLLPFPIIFRLKW